MSALIAGCRHGERESFTVNGKVMNESGNEIPGASVLIEGVSVFSGNDGSFSVKNLPSMDEYRVEVQADGYFKGFKNINNIDGGSISTKIHLLSKTIIGTIPAGGGSAGTTGLRVIAVSGAFKNGDGTKYRGPVEVAAR